MKKLLMLGGAQAQLAAIRKAKQLGHTVIVCDQDMDSPGKNVAHAFYPISTTDRQAVLQLARFLQVDGVMCYAADSGAKTAAYVAEQLGLPSSPYTSVDILTNKEKFRAFQQQVGLPIPFAKGYSCYEELLRDVELFTLPVMVKPVDAAGSQGVSKVETWAQLEDQVTHALACSVVKRFIVEQYIESPYPHIGGDGFSVDGQLVFYSLSNEYFSERFHSILATWPSVLPIRLQQKVQQTLQRCIALLQMGTCAYNFDIRVGHDEEVYVIELAPRNGGGCNPEAIYYATGVDLIRSTIQAALGETCRDLAMKDPQGHWMSYVIYSGQSGDYVGLEVERDFHNQHVVLYEAHCQPGQFVQQHEKIGTMILSFATQEELTGHLATIEWAVHLKIEDATARRFS